MEMTTEEEGQVTAFIAGASHFAEKCIEQGILSEPQVDQLLKFVTYDIIEGFRREYEKPKEQCTCHERDSTYICDFCKREQEAEGG